MGAAFCVCGVEFGGMFEEGDVGIGAAAGAGGGGGESHFGGSLVEFGRGHGGMWGGLIAGAGEDLGALGVVEGFEGGPAREAVEGIEGVSHGESHGGVVMLHEAGDVEVSGGFGEDFLGCGGEGVEEFGGLVTEHVDAQALTGMGRWALAA